MDIIKETLKSLYDGNLKPSYDNKAILNSISIDLINKDNLSEEDNNNLRDLILIANITYNNTDRDVLPFDDGLYDMMIEKYRKNNNGNYPVGATPINFSQQDHNEELIDNEEIQDAFHYMTEEEKSKMDKMLYDELIHPNYKLRREDMIQPAFRREEGYIVKRKHDIVHEHPDLVGTFNKCKYVLNSQAKEMGIYDDSNVSIVERDFFHPLIDAGIINPVGEQYTMIAELKYDGVSVEADCTDIVESARSRGDTEANKAIDMTPILRGYRFNRFTEKLNGAKAVNPIGIKFEAIVTYHNLPALNEMKNYNYKNGRTAIIGITGSSDAYRYRDLITLIPISTDWKDDNGEPMDRIEELELLNDLYSTGQPMRYSIITGDYQSLLFQMKRYVEEAEFARSYLPFMYDGVVFEFYDKDIRKKLGRDNSIDRYKVAVKFNPLKKQTIFRGYKYTIGQDGSITPMIYYDPVEFLGTIHPKSSGHSYKRFKDLDLHVGDIIDVTYVNDVMPYVSKPNNAHNRENAMRPYSELDTFPTTCPCCGGPLTISKTEKSVFCTNQECGNRVIKRLASTFEKLGIQDFKEERIKSVGFTHLVQYFLADENTPELDCLGPEIKRNLLKQLNTVKSNPIYDYEYFGSLGFTGIAKKTWQLIFSKVDVRDFIARFDMDMLRNIKGIGETTIEIIDREIEYFHNDIMYILNLNVVSSKGEQSKEQIRFTGFRDAKLEQTLRLMGYDADGNGGVTKSTSILLVPSEGYDSGNKVAKAKKYGIKIIPVGKFKSQLGLDESRTVSIDDLAE